MGSGKSTLAEGLADTFGMPWYPERYRENPWIAELYRGDRGAAFDCQFTSIKLAGANLRDSDVNPGVVEVTPSMVVATYTEALRRQGWLTDGQVGSLVYEAYQQNLATSRHVVNVHLLASPDALWKRIKARNRLMESTITYDYLETLWSCFNAFASSKNTDRATHYVIDTTMLSADAVLDYTMNLLMGHGHL